METESEDFPTSIEAVIDSGVDMEITGALVSVCRFVVTRAPDRREPPTTVSAIL